MPDLQDEPLCTYLPAGLQKQQFGQVQVTVTALEDFDHFLADDEEVRESAEEGITIRDSRGPQACIVEDGRLVGLSALKVVSIFDEQHRFAPRYDESNKRVHKGELEKVYYEIVQSGGV